MFIKVGLDGHTPVAGLPKEEALLSAGGCAIVVEELPKKAGVSVGDMWTQLSSLSGNESTSSILTALPGLVSTSMVREGGLEGRARNIGAVDLAVIRTGLSAVDDVAGRVSFSRAALAS